MDISYIISRSLKLAWQHKILWVFALMIGTASLNFNSLSNRNLFDDKNSEQTLNPTELNFTDYTMSNVLGDSVENITQSMDSVGMAPMYDTDYFKQLMAQSRPNFVLVSVGLIFYLGFFIFVTLFIRNWALGAMLSGVDDAIANRAYNLKKLGTYGRISNRELIKLQVYLTLIRLAASLVIIIPFSILFSMEQYIISTILLLLLILPFLVLIISLLYSELFAARFIAIHKLGFKPALLNGFRVFKKNFIDAIVLSCASCLISGIVFFVVFGFLILGVFGLLGTVSFSDEAIGAALIIFSVVIGVPLFFAFLIGMYALGAYFTTYANFAWSMFFNIATQKEGEINEQQ